MLKSKTFRLCLAIAASAATPTLAQDEPATFEVVRLGDASLSCEALVEQINDLNRQTLAIQTEMTEAGAAMSRDSLQATRRSGVAGGLAMGLGGLAASFVPGAGLVLGVAQAASQQAAASSAQAQQAAMMSRVNAMQARAADLAPLAQRQAHLAEIARERGC